MEEQEEEEGGGGGSRRRDEERCRDRRRRSALENPRGVEDPSRLTRWKNLARGRCRLARSARGGSLGEEDKEISGVLL